MTGRTGQIATPTCWPCIRRRSGPGRLAGTGEPRTAPTALPGSRATTGQETTTAGRTEPEGCGRHRNRAGRGGRSGGRGRGGGGRGKRIAAQVNLTIPLTTLLGLGHGMGDAGVFGLLDPEAARKFAGSAAGHPETRWCLTVTDRDGRAVAHGCARGPHPWIRLAARDGPGTDDGPAGQVIAGFLATLGVQLDPIAVGRCDHVDAEAGYVPSRRLRHKVHARTPTCSYWGCRRPAARCDDDHTLAWDDGGLTCQRNLSPLCRRHHRMKQHEGWQLDQPRPGILAWRTPGGRRYVTMPAATWPRHGNPSSRRFLTWSRSRP